MRRKEKRDGSKNKSFMVKKWDEILRDGSEYEGSENKSASPSRSRTRPTSNMGIASTTRKSSPNKTFIDLHDLAVKKGWNKSIKIDVDQEEARSKRSREYMSSRKSPKFGQVQEIIKERRTNHRNTNSIMKSKRYMEYSPVPEPDDHSKDGCSATRDST